MAFDDLNLDEQEQLAALKAWWQERGGLVVLVLTAIALGFAGWQGWHWYERRQAAHAGALYETLLHAVQGDDARAVHLAGGRLIEKYPSTLYASMGALVSARFDFDHGELKDSEAQLRWAAAHSGSKAFRNIARLRLAAVLLDRKDYKAALAELDHAHAPAFAAQYAALKGDVLVAMKRTAAAKAAYRLALDKAAPQDEALRDSVRIRLDALGG